MVNRISCLALSISLFLVALAPQAIATEEPTNQDQSAAAEAYEDRAVLTESEADGEQAAPAESEADGEQAAPTESETDGEQAAPTESEADGEQTAPTESETDGSWEEAAVQEGPGVIVDGVRLDAPLYVCERTTYISLRALVCALRPDAAVTWTGDHAEVSAPGLSMTVYPYSTYFVANGRYLYVPKTVWMDGGVVFVPLRTLARALDAQVEWDAETGSTYVTSGSGAIVPGDQFYDPQILNLLSHIIYSESGNQPLAGKIAVGNVILNRVASPIFPNTVYEVIYQRGQFAPSSSLQMTPNAESVAAAKLCMDGAVVLSNALWFNRVSTNSWASRNKTWVATIGAHAFYG